MSAPTCTPAKFSRDELAQAVFEVLTTAPVSLRVFALAEFDVVFSVTSPPMTRPQTPPPGWSGAGFAGAETNALPCWVRNAVLTLPIAPEIAAPAAPAGTASCDWLPRVIGPFCTVVQFGTATPGGIGSACANAPPEADSITIKVVPARIFFRTPRDPAK